MVMTSGDRRLKLAALAALSPAAAAAIETTTLMVIMSFRVGICLRRIVLLLSRAANRPCSLLPFVLEARTLRRVELRIAA